MKMFDYASNRSVHSRLKLKKTR